MKHIHAELMMEYAKDALETDKPWERWECLPFKGLGTKWNQVEKYHHWDVDICYRRKPPTITINGFDVPEPYRGMMMSNQSYYITRLHKFYYEKCFWEGSDEDCWAKRKGLVHMSAEAAQIHGKALASFTEAG